MTTSVRAQTGPTAEKRPPTRQELIERHVHLVHQAARRVMGALPPHVDPAEIVGHGILGLLEALDRLAPERQLRHDGQTGDDPSLDNAAFEAIASQRIWQRIVEALGDMDWLGAAGRQRVRTMVRAGAELEAELGRPATEEEFATHLDIATTELCHWLEEASRLFITSLDQFVWIADPAAPSDEDGNRWAACLPRGEQGKGQEWEGLERALARAISRLPQEDRLVVALYYYEELSLAEIAQVLDISERRAMQIHGRAGLRLRSLLAGSAAGAGSVADADPIADGR